MERGKTWIASRLPQALPTVVALQAPSAPFPASVFTKPVLQTKPSAWWKAIRASSPAVDANFTTLAGRLCTAPASSAAVERVFSKFGAVHSTLRNRLSPAVVQKLVFVSKALGEKEAPVEDE